MAFVIKDCKQVKSATMATTLPIGTVTVVNITTNYATDDATKSIIKGTVNTSETVVLVLTADDAPDTIIATVKTDASGVYGFAFTPTADKKYSLDVYKIVS